MVSALSQEVKNVSLGVGLEPRSPWVSVLNTKLLWKRVASSSVSSLVTLVNELWWEGRFCTLHRIRFNVGVNWASGAPDPKITAVLEI